MLNKIYLTSLFLMFCFISNGCKESKYERLERLENNGYYYSNTGTLNRSLWHLGDDKNVKIVPTIIIDIEYVFPYVTLIRQKSSFFICGPIEYEILNDFEYWIINVEDDSKDSLNSYDLFLKKAESLNIKRGQLLQGISSYKSQNKTVRPVVVSRLDSAESLRLDATENCKNELKGTEGLSFNQPSPS